MGGAEGGHPCESQELLALARDQRPLSAFVYFAVSRDDLPDRVWEGGFWNIFLPPRGGKLFQDVSGLPYGRETEPSGALDDLEWVAVLGRHPGIGITRGGSNQIAPSLLCTS